MIPKGSIPAACRLRNLNAWNNRKRCETRAAASGCAIRQSFSICSANGANSPPSPSLSLSLLSPTGYFSRFYYLSESVCGCKPGVFAATTTHERTRIKILVCGKFSGKIAGNRSCNVYSANHRDTILRDENKRALNVSRLHFTSSCRNRFISRISHAQHKHVFTLRPLSRCRSVSEKLLAFSQTRKIFNLAQNL